MTITLDAVRGVARGSWQRIVHAILVVALWFSIGSFLAVCVAEYVPAFDSKMLTIFTGAFLALSVTFLKPSKG